MNELLKKVPFRDKIVDLMGEVSLNFMMKKALILPIFRALRLIIINEGEVEIPYFGKFVLKQKIDHRFKVKYWAVDFKMNSTFKKEIKKHFKDMNIQESTNEAVAQQQIGYKNE